MKDIDFDELDRAVASALNASNTKMSSEEAAISTNTSATVSSSDAPTKTEETTSRSISSHGDHARFMSSRAPVRTALARKPVLTGATPTPTPTPTPTAPPPTTSPAESRQPADETQAPQVALDTKPRRTIPHREGRFMDVVRPGAKPSVQTSMAEKPVVSETPAPMRRDPVAVASPRLSSQSHNASLEAKINNLFANEGQAPIVDNVPKKVDTTPLDSDMSAETMPPQTYIPEEDTVSIDDLAIELGAPLEDVRSDSPFITDAKVEKRPLGGLEPLETDAPDDTATDAADLAPKIDDTPGAPVPEELATDITAIESQETVSSVETIMPQSASPRAQMNEKISLHATEPTSIARQYKEQPRIAFEDDEAGAIFDPQTYQAPVEHPAKKSSGWAWVLACVLIIVLATIAGVMAWMEGILPVPL